MPMHDWAKVEAGIYHDFHNLWLGTIRHALNNGLLPTGYYALGERKSAGIVADILTLQGPPPAANGPPPVEGGGPGLTTGRPAVAVLEKEKKVKRRPGRRLTIRHVSTHKVVAVVELVSPGNKDSRPHLAEFVAKAGSILAAGIHVLVIDPFPPPAHAPGGLHAAIWKKVTRPRKGKRPFTPPANRPLVAASYCASSSEVTAAVQTFAVGEPVPDIPLYLTADEEYVTVPLEATYAAAWPDVPKVWRGVLES
jgi:hypothetical protein